MLQCSPLDEIIPPLYFAYILTFETANTQSAETLFQNLSRGYRQLLNAYPVLTTLITRNDSNTERHGHIDLILPTVTETKQLIKIDLTSPESGWKYSYQDLKDCGMPSNRLDARILAPLTAGIGHAGGVFSAQYNAIPGGVLLAVCFSHTFVDANGAFTIIKLWADHCRDGHNEQLLLEGLLHSHNGENLINAQLQTQTVGDYQSLKENVELWKLLGLDWKQRLQSGSEAQVPELPIAIPAAAVRPGQSSTVSRIVFFSSDKLRALKDMATSKALSPGDHWISTNDAIVAFLWKHIMRARFPAGTDINANGRSCGKDSEGAESIVTVAINGRKELLLPQSYIGNVIFCNMCSVPLHTVIAPTTELSQLTRSIRQTIQKNKNQESLSAALMLASCIPSNVLRRLRYGFTDFVGQYLVTSSWIDLPLYDLNWGSWNPKEGIDGHIDFFRIPANQFEGITCILPRKRNGVVEVMVGMKTDAMARLLADQDFLSFAKVVSD